MSKRNPSMGGIEAPEELDINQELGRQIVGDSFGKGSGQMSNQINMLASSSFAKASEKYDGIEKIENLSNARARAKREEDLDFMKSIAKKPAVVRRTIDNDTSIKVKIGGKYVKLKKLIATCVIVICVLSLFFLFCPPVFVTNVLDSSVSSDNIFAYKNINELKVDYADKYSMEDNDAFNSEKAENYKEVYIKFYVVNMSIFQTRVPQFELATSHSKNPERIVYVGNDDPHATIQPFSKGEVTVKVLVNVEGMSNSDFGYLVKGLVFRTVEMDRKVTKNTFCPSVPALIYVSDELNLTI